MNWYEYKFHASSIGDIMTDPRSGPGLSETCKKHLLICWIKGTYDREKDIENKYMRKGTLVEEDSLTLYSRAKKTPFFKNDKVLENDFIIGTPDIITDEIIDIKSSWDIFTFYNVMFAPMNKSYLYQLQSYMVLTGITLAKLVYCLVNTPEFMVDEQKYYLAKRMGSVSGEDELYLEAAAKLEKNMIYDDIPLEKRYIEFTIPFAPALMEKVQERIIECREFLSKL